MGLLTVIRDNLVQPCWFTGNWAGREKEMLPRTSNSRPPIYAPPYLSSQRAANDSFPTLKNFQDNILISPGHGTRCTGESGIQVSLGLIRKIKFIYVQVNISRLSAFKKYKYIHMTLEEDQIKDIRKYCTISLNFLNILIYITIYYIG